MRKGIDDLKSLVLDEPAPYDGTGKYTGVKETEAEYLRRRHAYEDQMFQQNCNYIRRLRIAGEYGKEVTTEEIKSAMKIEIDIPIALAGLVMSLEVEELDDDKIVSDFESSDHYDDLFSYGLLSSHLSDDGPEYHLTHLGRLVYERRSKL